MNAAFRLIVRPTNEPKNCKADATYNSVSLSWSPVADANGYTITRKVEGSDTEQTIAHVDGTDTVSYKDTAAQTESAIFIMYMPIQNIRTTDRRIMPIRIPMHP